MCGEALFWQDFSLVRFFSSIGKEMNRRWSLWFTSIKFQQKRLFLIYKCTGFCIYPKKPCIYHGKTTLNMAYFNPNNVFAVYQQTLSSVASIEICRFIQMRSDGFIISKPHLGSIPRTVWPLLHDWHGTSVVSRINWRFYSRNYAKVFLSFRRNLVG